MSITYVPAIQPALTLRPLSPFIGELVEAAHRRIEKGPLAAIPVDQSLAPPPRAEAELGVVLEAAGLAEARVPAADRPPAAAAAVGFAGALAALGSGDAPEAGFDRAV
jgi:hypothetical protein